MDTLKREVLAQRVRRVKPSGIRKFFDIINTMPDVISLGVGEPDFVTPEHIRQAGIRSIELGHTRYTSNYGILALREEIAAKKPIEMIAGFGEHVGTYKIDYHGGERFPHLERDSARPDLLQQIIKPSQGRK